MTQYKYPRTPHFHFSPGKTSDDKVIKDYLGFIGKEVVVTEKMDGENTTMYRDLVHARSIDGRSHVSRDWVKAFHRSFAYRLHPDVRICGENLYATHSLSYDDLESYFYGFSLWEKNFCFDWDFTKTTFIDLGITPVRELYRGVFDLQVIQDLAESLDITKHEGLVCRTTAAFMFEDFGKHVAKWVRADHVETDEHWMSKEVIPNQLKK